MSSVECYFCGQAILPTMAGDSCTNCGAPLAFQSNLPTLPLGPGQTQEFVTDSWLAGPRSTLLGKAPPAGNATGLLGQHSVLNSLGQEKTDASEHKPLLDGIARLEGKVDSPPTKNTVDVPLEWWSQGALRLLFPPVFIMLSRYFLVAGSEPASADKPQQKPTMSVYTLRVRRDDQTLGEARLEGDLIEGEPSVGDHVSLCGHYRGNTLIVKNGINYSFQPPMRIKVRQPLPLRRARIGVIVLASLLLLTFGLFLWFLPLFAYHSGTTHLAGQWLRDTYLSPGIAFGIFAFVLYSLSGWLMRILLLLLVVVAGLAVYTAVGGAALPPFPLHW